MDDIYKKVAQAVEKKADHYDLLQEEYPQFSTDEQVNMFNDEREETEESEPFSFTLLTLMLLGLLAVLILVIDLVAK